MAITNKGKNAEEEIAKVIDEIERDYNIEPEKEMSLEEKARNTLYIPNMHQIMTEVLKLDAEKEFNPSIIQDADAPTVHLNGEPHMIINDEYVKYDTAQVILQTQKVAREYLKLKKLIKK